MIEEIDYGTIILENARRIATIADQLKQETATTTALRQHLPSLTVSVCRIMHVLFPMPDVGKLFGMPDGSYAAQAPQPVFFDRDNHDWNFKPWFQEKFSKMYQAFYRIIDEADRNDVLNGREIVTLQTYNNLILEMLDSGRIAISDVKIDELADPDDDDEQQNRP